MLDVAQNTPKIEATPLFSTAHVADRRRAEAWLSARLARGNREVFSETVELTPVLAELLLDRNPDNRKVHWVDVSKYATDIVEGGWQYNGESIKISRDGLLNDGQHRCLAVKKAGTSIQTAITFGLERDTRLTVDQGVVRGAADYLSMDSIPDANHASKVAGLLWQYDRRKAVTNRSEMKPTKRQVQETYHANPEISDSVRFCSLKGNHIVGGKSNLAFCHFMFSKKDPAKAKDFFKSLILGEGPNMKRGNAVHAARQYMLENPKLSMELKIELLFRAWNAFIHGRSMIKPRLDGTLPPLEA